MVYFTGDSHGTADSYKFFNNSLTKDDTLVVCGDFGVPNNAELEDLLYHTSLTQLPYTIAFVDGSEENYPLLNEYPEVPWSGDIATQIGTNIFHMHRGGLYSIEGKSVWCMGGGAATNIPVRDKDMDWWPEEMPNDSEIEKAENVMEAVDWNVDYIVTHSLPISAELLVNTSVSPNKLTAFLERVLYNARYKQWYAGRQHINRSVTKFKVQTLYNEIVGGA